MVKVRSIFRHPTPPYGWPKTRAEAVKKGLPRFRTGVPCLKGHIGLRATSSGACMTCLDEWKKGEGRDKYRKYQREAKKKMRDRYRENRDRRLADSEKTSDLTCDPV